MSRAVVFAYHNVGVRCLSVLLAGGVDVPLVLTHPDDPRERIWFDSVARLAQLHDIPVITPANPNTPEVLERVRGERPDFLFSFYYRHMLKPELLALPGAGALNMHGSLLPRYRGRVPVNWAVIHGETETGATLHYMTVKPDAGDIVDRQAVPILPNDTAGEVFHKVTWAAELVLHRSLPDLLNGTAPRLPQDLAAGSYFGGRRPEDGLIRWNDPARHIHNLVRGVAPPYPGAFTRLRGKLLKIFSTLPAPGRPPRFGRPTLSCEASGCYAECGDGAALRLLELELDGVPVDAATLGAFLEGRPEPLC